MASLNIRPLPIDFRGFFWFLELLGCGKIALSPIICWKPLLWVEILAIKLTRICNDSLWHVFSVMEVYWQRFPVTPSVKE